MTTAPKVIVAYTGEGDRYRAMRKAAVATAAQSEARLIFYDIDAAPKSIAGISNPLEGSPMPTSWSGEGETQLFGDSLMPEDLERAGRHGAAQMVEEARRAGVDAYGWLPSSRGGDDLVKYATEQGANLVLLPAELEDPGIMQRLRGVGGAEKAAEDSGLPVALVDESGKVAYPQHDAQHEGEAKSLEASAKDQGRR